MKTDIITGPGDDFLKRELKRASETIHRLTQLFESSNTREKVLFEALKTYVCWGCRDEKSQSPCMNYTACEAIKKWNALK